MADIESRGIPAVGVATKAARYREPSSADTAVAEARIISRYQQFGWVVRANLKPRPTHPYHWLVFDKAACPTPVMVSLLSSNPEARRLVELNHGGDVAFFEDDHRSETSPFQNWPVVSWLQRTMAGSKMDALPELPPLAVAPAPRAGDAACAGPFTPRRAEDAAPEAQRQSGLTDAVLANGTIPAKTAENSTVHVHRLENACRYLCDQIVHRPDRTPNNEAIRPRI